MLQISLVPLSSLLFLGFANISSIDRVYVLQFFESNCEGKEVSIILRLNILVGICSWSVINCCFLTLILIFKMGRLEGAEVREMTFPKWY